MYFGLAARDPLSVAFAEVLMLNCPQAPAICHWGATRSIEEPIRSVAMFGSEHNSHAGGSL
jgi:hypothetical protein